MLKHFSVGSRKESVESSGRRVESGRLCCVVLCGAVVQLCVVLCYVFICAQTRMFSIRAGVRVIHMLSCGQNGR